MNNPYRDENVSNWAGDFTASDSLTLFPHAVREVAQAVLETLLLSACGLRDVEPTELVEDDIKSALLDHVASLDIPVEAKPFIPSLCRAYLGDLQRRGRVGNGQTLGRYVGALKEAFLAANPGKATTFRRPGSKIGRNDPCPCGSGKKYKKCHGT